MVVVEGPGKKKKPANVTVRQMDMDDLAAVFHLGEKLFKAEVAPNLYRTWDEYEVAGLFLEDSEYCLVAEMDDRIVGFALGTTVSKTRSAWKYGHLVWLGVDVSLQTRGIGEKLFHQFKTLMVEDGVKILLVDSEANNLAALRFFRKMGFGNPRQHIYLSLNLSTPRRVPSKKGNGNRAAKERSSS